MTGDQQRTITYIAGLVILAVLVGAWVVRQTEPPWALIALVAGMLGLPAVIQWDRIATRNRNGGDRDATDR